jgi:hypothetical protein
MDAVVLSAFFLQVDPLALSWTAVVFVTQHIWFSHLWKELLILLWRATSVAQFPDCTPGV